MQGRPKFSELHAIRIRNFSGLYSPAFGPNMKRLKYFSLFSPNAGKCGPEKLRIWTLFTQYWFISPFHSNDLFLYLLKTEFNAFLVPTYKFFCL